MMAMERPSTIRIEVPRRIIDAHVHVGLWPEFDLELTLGELESVMARFGYEGAVVMPALRGDALKANITLHKKVMYDSRFHLFAWVDPTSNVLGWLESEPLGLRGLKFHPSISQVSALDPVMQPYLEFADSRGLPFLYHSGRAPISWPDRLMPIVDSYPRVKFILAHLGGNAFDRIALTMKRWPTLPENVYVESSTARHPDLLSRAVGQWGDDRVLYGTDIPFTDMRMNWACVEYAGLEEHEGFLGGNLERLLKSR